MSPKRRPHPLLVLTSSLLALAVTGSAWAASDARNGVRFASAPRRVLQGHSARVVVDVQPRRTTCSLVVRYRNGASQGGLRPVATQAGRASWTWQVPHEATAGPATATVSCSRAGRATRQIVVVGDTIPFAIKVMKQGFSVRPTTRGSQLSYGVLLANQSPDFDAEDIQAVVNFVGPGDVLIGSAASPISIIGAGSEYGLGGMVTFPAGAPVERLEVALRIGARVPRTLRLPAVANARVLPNLREPSWVGSVEGEILNDTRFTLTRASLSVLVFDGNGEILGGGTGRTLAPVEVGARQFFKVTSGLAPIIFGRAASALISIQPTYS